MIFKNVAAIILAAGKGTRINAKDKNKVMFKLADKPMVAYAVERLKKAKIGQIVLVIGFAKDSVVSYFNDSVSYVVQEKRLGTGHAAKTGLSKLKKGIDYVLVLHGDDSAFYPTRVFKKLIKACQKEKRVLSFITLEMKKPRTARVIRNRNGDIVRIVEEQEATEWEKKIKEINVGCYCFKRSFLEKFITVLEKNKTTGEYHLPDMIKIAISEKLPIKAVKIKNEDFWCGVNTREELSKARQQIKKLHARK